MYSSPEKINALHITSKVYPEKDITLRVQSARKWQITHLHMLERMRQQPARKAMEQPTPRIRKKEENMRLLPNDRDEIYLYSRVS